MSKSPSLRRIQADIRELALDPSDRYHAVPLENDMFEWHFTIRGADGTDFEGGVYHGRILLPPDYPFKPPHIMFLTASGRFETNTKICLSFSAYHPELWQPAWGIRLILEALISFLPTPADGAIGALDWSAPERKRLAKKSVDYFCPVCGKKPVDLLPPLKGTKGTASATKSRFQKEIEELQRLQFAEHQKEVEEAKQLADNTTTEEAAAATTTAASETADAPASTSTNEQVASATLDAPVSASVALEVTEDNAGLVSTTDSMPLDTSASSLPQTTEMTTTTTKSTAHAGITPVAGQIEDTVKQKDESKQTVPHEIPAVSDEAGSGRPVPEAEPQQPIAAEGILSSWWVDPILHFLILLFSVVALLLIKKVKAIIADIRALDVD